MSFKRIDLYYDKKLLSNENKCSKGITDENISKENSLYSNSNNKYYTPLNKKYVDISSLSTAKMTNLTSLSKKPSLNSSESRFTVKKREDKSLEEIIKKQKKNLIVPINRKDDEAFKLLTMKNIKKKCMPVYKSAKKIEDIEARKELDSAIEYSIVKKKSITHSVKKNLYIIHRLYDDDDKEYKFPLFKDADIGINEYWQNQIVESNEDEDIDTDEDVLDSAVACTLLELEEALNEVKEKGINVIDRLK